MNPRVLLTALIRLVYLLLPPVSMARDFLDVYQLALENDSEYRVAIQANRVARELRPQAMAGLLPTMELALSAAENEKNIRKGGIYKREGLVGYTSREVELTITQPIYHKDRWIGLGQAKGRVKKADLTLTLEYQKLMIRAAERYFEVLEAEDGLAFSRAEKAATDQQLRQAQKRLEVGLVPTTDVREAQARYDVALAREIDARSELGNAHKALWEITGRPIPELDPLKKKIPLVFPEPNDMEQWTRAAAFQNLELAVARQETEITAAEIRRINAGHLPTLDLVGSHDRLYASKDQYGPTDTRTSSLTLEFNFPFYQGGLISSQGREAVHRHRQAMEEMNKIGREVQRKTHAAFGGVISEISRVIALQQALQSSEAALAAIEMGVEVGTRDFVDILDAQRELFRAKKEYAQARYKYVLNILRLKQAAGTLSEQDIVAIDGWLEHPAPEHWVPKDPSGHMILAAKTDPSRQDSSVRIRKELPEEQASRHSPSQARPVHTIAWLREQNPNHHTIQLLGTRSQKAMWKFIEKHQLEKQEANARVAWFKTSHQNKDWFIIVYGVYPTREAARAEIQTLPEALRRLEPFRKNIGRIIAAAHDP
uniref:Outer membrane protein n=1 Tax=Candidatus Kentrum sp. FM TaxID=2126340 RepID=A0A450T2G6_9GAMM|nr:MAG: outer membrane protein [Candidatus Kentron sp. FM]VFJ61922.1 MAG: outer membrane protein [Candidatus Kentron sp. FM]VFK10906.1 MAG: outer membrane protein [Candidatus Kentron sp. FM]